MTYPPTSGSPYPGSPPYGPPPVPPQPPKKKHTGLIVALSVVGGIVAICLFGGIIVAAAGGGDKGSPGASHTPAAEAAAGQDAVTPAASSGAPTRKPSPAAKPTVVFTLTGSAPSGVDISYGSDSDNRQGGSTSPWKASLRRDDSGGVSWYDMTAQLQGGGDITCQILIDGAVIASGHASGGYNICSAQISQSFTGKWSKV
jgi:hypothetical protein